LAPSLRLHPAYGRLSMLERGAETGFAYCGDSPPKPRQIRAPPNTLIRSMRTDAKLKEVRRDED